MERQRAPDSKAAWSQSQPTEEQQKGQPSSQAGEGSDQQNEAGRAEEVLAIERGCTREFEVWAGPVQHHTLFALNLESVSSALGCYKIMYYRGWWLRDDRLVFEFVWRLLGLLRLKHWLLLDLFYRRPNTWFDIYPCSSNSSPYF